MQEIILVSPKLGIGGIQRALTNLANWLVSKNIKVYLISCKKEDLFYPLDNKVEVITPIFDYSIKCGKIVYYYKVVKYLRGHIKRINSNYVISFGETFNPLVLISCSKLNKYVYISDRTSPDYHHPLITKLLRKNTYPYADALILQTTRSLNYNRNKFSDLKKVVIPNFIQKMKGTVNNREKIVLYIGRFAWEKAPERLIEAFSKIGDKKGYKLVMCGNGPLLEQMKLLSENLGIKDEVIFEGQVSDVQSFYNRASIFVLPSVLEGFPNALCEAMSSGLACICYNSIPFEDIGVPGKDLIVVGENYENLEMAISSLMNDDVLRNKIARQAITINQRLSDEMIGEKFLNLMGI